MPKDKQVLGKGLDILFGASQPEEVKSSEQSAAETPEKTESILFIDIENIKANPYQPREEFEGAELEELADSIKQRGVIQAVTVRKTDGGYELLSGERRLRASKMAGLEKIPAYILDVSKPEDLLEISLIENIQRKDLNAIEVAHGYQRLIAECKLTQEEVAVKVGKSRSAVTNFLRMLKLPDVIKASIRKGEIMEGHARAILAVDNPEEQVVLWKKILGENLSVRKAEEITKTLKKQQKPKKIFEVTNQDKAAIDFLESKFREHFGTKVKIHPRTKTSGEIIIEYFTSEDLERIIELCKK
jgi:ParB family chromosome partitioning protein